jgi:hypothetical protein
VQEQPNESELHIAACHDEDMSFRTKIEELQSTINTFRASLAHVTLDSAAKQKMMHVI